MTTLIELVERIDELDEEGVIFVKSTWTAGAEAQCFHLTCDHRAPHEALSQGFRYFLEVDVIKQVLDEFLTQPAATLTEKCSRIIEYATYDA